MTETVLERLVMSCTECWMRTSFVTLCFWCLPTSKICQMPWMQQKSQTSWDCRTWSSATGRPENDQSFFFSRMDSHSHSLNAILSRPSSILQLSHTTQSTAELILKRDLQLSTYVCARLHKFHSWLPSSIASYSLISLQFPCTFCASPAVHCKINICTVAKNGCLITQNTYSLLCETCHS